MEIGKIGFGMKSENAQGRQKVEKTGAIAYNLIKNHCGSFKERNEINEAVQKEIVEYNFPKFKKLRKEDPEKAKAFYEKYWKKCTKVPVKILDFDYFRSGRCCWPKDFKADGSFCTRLEPLGVITGKAWRIKEDGEGREEVICNPKSCPYAQGEKDGNQKCKNLTRLALHVDLPSAQSGAGFYGLRTTSWNSRAMLESQLTALKNITCGFISTIPLELFQIQKTVKRIDKGKEKYEKVPVLCIRPTVSYEEILILCHKQAQFVELAGRAKQVMDKVRHDFAFTKDDVDTLMTGYDDLAEIEEEMNKELENTGTLAMFEEKKERVSEAAEEDVLDIDDELDDDDDWEIQI